MSTPFQSYVTQDAKVLVTGGAGFIGSHLCELLVNLGYQVIVYDDLRSGSLMSVDTISQKIRFRRCTVGATLTMREFESAVESSNFVFHLASPVGVQFVHSNPVETYQSICRAGRTVVELCRRHRVPLLFTSSSEVYGANPTSPITEDAQLTTSTAPRFAYAAGKIEVERMIFEQFDDDFPDVWIARLFNITGPRQRPDAGVLAAFSFAAVNGSSLHVHDDGKQKRSFLHAKDAVNAFVHIAGHRELRGRPVNVGSEDPVAIDELAHYICSEGCHQGVVRAGYSEFFGDEFVPVLDRYPSTKLIRETTSWRPHLSFDAIIRDCIDYAESFCHEAAGDGQTD